MNDLERSLMLERAFTDASHIVCELKTYNWNECNRARMNGQEPNPMFKNWIDMLENVKKTIRKESDRAFLKHKKTHPIVSNQGALELATAVLAQAAHDYEKAICSYGEEAENTIKEIERFAEREACLYTTLDFSEILRSIQYKHKLFKRKAHRDIESILYYTKKLKKHGYYDKYNPNRCPLCGGGLYAQGKATGKRFTVVCTGCEMKEAIELGA